VAAEFGEATPLVPGELENAIQVMAGGAATKTFLVYSMFLRNLLPLLSISIILKFFLVIFFDRFSVAEDGKDIYFHWLKMVKISIFNG